MSRLKNNPNICLDELHMTSISFQIATEISILDDKTKIRNVLKVEEKGWRKVIFGTTYDKNSVRIEAVGKKPLHKSIIMTMTTPTDRSSNRVVGVNGKKIGVLEECLGLRNSYWIHALPYHHAMKNWETLYYDNSTRDVQIYYKGHIFAAAKYYDGVYKMLILKDEYLPLCIGLAIAAIDSKDNRYTRFGK